MIDTWEAVYVPAIEAAVRGDLARAREFVRVAGAPAVPDDAETLAATAVDVLWYNVFGANDATDKLGGNPFDNMRRRYRRSTDDARLNARVARVAAAPSARGALAAYDTAGTPGVPLVTLHPPGIPSSRPGTSCATPSSSTPAAAGRVAFVMPVRYGHCHFTVRDMLEALRLMRKLARAAR